MLHELFVLPDMGPSGQIIQHSVDKLPAAYDAMLAARPPLPADIEAALKLAKEFCADPDKRAQVKAQLAANGWPQLADMIDEAVLVSRALLKACGREP